MSLRVIIIDESKLTSEAEHYELQKIVESSAVLDKEVGSSEAEAIMKSVGANNGASESALSASEEQYKAIGLSTGHVKESDHVILERMASKLQYNQVMNRETGWLVKLYDGSDMITDYFKALSPEFREMLVTVYKSGFRMIEFDMDIDPEEHPMFPSYC